MMRITSPLSFENRKYFVLILFLFLLSVTPSLGNDSGCVKNYDPNLDYFPDKTYPVYSQRYLVDYFLNYKILHHPSVNQTYVLYQCGTPQPTVIKLPNVKYFSVPLQNIAVTETVVLTFLEFLGVQDRIKFLDPTYVSSPCIQLLGQRGSYIPFSNNQTIRNGQYNLVDGIFTSQFSPNWPPKDILQTASQELEPLQRAEWIKFISYFFNLEVQARSVFEGILQRYDCHKNDQKDIINKATIAWVDYEDWASPPYWDVDTSDYQRKFVFDAGGSLVNSSDPIKTVEELHQFLSKIDFLIDMTYISPTNVSVELQWQYFLKNYGLTEDSQFPFMKNSQVWRFDRLQNPNGGYDWFESAIVEVGLVLEEIIHIMYPNYEPDHPMIWFRNIASKEPIDISDPSDCHHNPNVTRLPRADLCDSNPTPGAPILLPLMVLMSVLVVAGIGLIAVYRPCMKWYPCSGGREYIVINPN